MEELPSSYSAQSESAQYTSTEAARRLRQHVFEGDVDDMEATEEELGAWRSDAAGTGANVHYRSVRTQPSSNRTKISHDGPYVR